MVFVACFIIARYYVWPWSLFISFLPWSWFLCNADQSHSTGTEIRVELASISHSSSIVSPLYPAIAKTLIANIATNGFTIASDLIILTLPIPTLSQIKRTRMQKVALICVFGAGAFSTIARLGNLAPTTAPQKASQAL